jgi:hypothetical protein
LAVLQDLVIGLLVLLHRLLHLDGVDLDAVQALRKLRVEVELVFVLNLASLRRSTHMPGYMDPEQCWMLLVLMLFMRSKAYKLTWT